MGDVHIKTLGLYLRKSVMLLLEPVPQLLKLAQLLKSSNPQLSPNFIP